MFKDLLKHGGIAMLSCLAGIASGAVAVSYFIEGDNLPGWIWALAGLLWVFNTGLHAANQYFQGQLEVRLENLRLITEDMMEQWPDPDDQPHWPDWSSTP